MIHRRFSPALLTCLALLLLTSCVHAPFLSEGGEKQSSQVISKGWWHSLNDPLVNELADISLRQNLNLQIAQARVREARALRQTALSGFFPTIDATGSASRGDVGSSQLASLAQGGFDTRWELDVFGQTRASVRGAIARTQAAQASADDVRHILIADVARAVTEWRQAQETLRATQSLVTSQNETVEILTARVKAGLSDASALERAKAQQLQTRATFDIATAATNSAQYQIERLLNVRDDRVVNILSRYTTSDFAIPTIENLDAITVDMMRNRPDIRASRATLLAARADVDLAEATLWPRISLSSFFGVQDGSNGLQLAGNPAWSLASNITIPLLNFGKLRGAVKAADARATQALLSHENNINLALQETRTALSDYINGMNALRVQTDALTSRQNTVKLSQERFKRGLSDMTDVTTAQAELDSTTITVINQKAATRIAYIRLQKALGL
jgi:NodT family efflux transporter outer membrane factor (OMF) lipoprotein